MVEKSKDTAVHFLKVAPWFVHELVLAMSEWHFILLGHRHIGEPIPEESLNQYGIC